MPKESQGVTDDLLEGWKAGRRDALDQLFDRLYASLHQLAHVQLRQRHPAETLQTTALLNELYCKLAEQDSQHWKDRNHFYAACATTMRHHLVDTARRRLREKRGGGEQLLTLDERRVPAEGDPDWLLELDRLMEALAEHDPRMVSVFECRYFAGFTTSETAKVLSLSIRTVERDWTRVRAWLQSALAAECENPDG